MSACHYSWTRHALREAFFLSLAALRIAFPFSFFFFFCFAAYPVRYVSAEYTGRSPFVDVIRGINEEKRSGCLFGVENDRITARTVSHAPILFAFLSLAIEKKNVSRTIPRLWIGFLDYRSRFQPLIYSACAHTRTLELE